MAYPQPPEIATSYTAAEQALGDGTLPGQELDVDLAAVQASITAVIEFLKLSLRSDGKLNNGSVSSDTLASSLIIGFDPPAPWMTGTSYTTSSTVFQGFGFYLCVTAHTSGVFASDLASGRWVLLADLTPPGGALIGSNNLSDVPDKPTARLNLGLGSMATAVAGTGAAQYRTNSQNDAVYQALAAALTSWASVTRAAGFDAFAATPSSANLRALLADESGAGAALFAGGALGTPASGVLTNCTGLPVSGLDAAGVVTAAETIAANNNDTTVPTSAAVKAYADTKGWTYLALTSHASGGPYDFTIPVGVTDIEVIADRVSLSSTGNFFVQVGPSGGAVNTGYTSVSGNRIGETSVTNGFVMQAGVAASLWSGTMKLQLIDAATNAWVSTHILGPNTGGPNWGSGQIALAGALEVLRWNYSGGNTPDGGNIRVRYR